VVVDESSVVVAASVVVTETGGCVALGEADSTPEHALRTSTRRTAKRMTLPDGVFVKAMS
jgi:hypothetical protein